MFFQGKMKEMSKSNELGIVICAPSQPHLDFKEMIIREIENSFPPTPSTLGRPVKISPRVFLVDGLRYYVSSGWSSFIIRDDMIGFKNVSRDRMPIWNDVMETVLVSS